MYQLRDQKIMPVKKRWTTVVLDIWLLAGLIGGFALAPYGMPLFLIICCFLVALMVTHVIVSR